MTWWLLLQRLCWSIVALGSCCVGVLLIRELPPTLAGPAGSGGGSEGAWRWALPAMFLGAGIVGSVLVKLALLPDPSALQAGKDERGRIMTAASGTGKAAAAIAAGLVAAGFKDDASFPPWAVVGVVWGIALLLLLSAQASYSVRDL